MFYIVSCNNKALPLIPVWLTAVKSTRSRTWKYRSKIYGKPGFPLVFWLGNLDAQDLRQFSPLRPLCLWPKPQLMLGVCHTKKKHWSHMKQLTPLVIDSMTTVQYDKLQLSPAQVYTEIGRGAIKSKRQSLGLRPTTGLSAVACGLPRSSACTSNSTLSWEGEIARPPRRDRCPPGINFLPPIFTEQRNKTLTFPRST